MKSTASAKRNSKSNGSSTRAKAKRRKQTVPFALCVRKGTDCGDLQLAKLYAVRRDPVAAREGYLRVIDDSGEDYLYPAEYFLPQRVPKSVARLLSMPPK